jgi:UDP-N-acetylglucosamine--N-acetylmuramyl-(pentapeptide) pyrophosphoryl-undecaprenol N-acetylglucosamine transferase
VVPALAVADELRDSGAEVSFLGARERAEAELVPAAGFEIDLLRVRGLDRRNPLRAARAVGLAARAVIAARALVRERDADVVLGGGGYVAGPAGLAALALRRPLVLTEADRRLGLANRLLARGARRVCLAFPIPGLESDRYLVTGRPVRAAIATADRVDARRRFRIAASDRCLLVVGGSQGARSINLAALEAFVDPGQAPAARRDYHVLHISGHRDHAEAAARLRQADAGERYTLLAYEDGLGDALAASDLVLARAGGSIFEIAAAGRPAILVPYPHAAGRHQHANAEWMTEAGAAIVLEDSELDAVHLRGLADELLGDPECLARMSAASTSLARPDAAARVAEEVLAAARASARASRDN